MSQTFIERADMYAVIKTGGKQYRVAAGEKIKVEQIAADVGQEIVFDQVLAVGNGTELKVGTPLVSGATVTVTVIAHGKHDNVRIFNTRIQTFPVSAYADVLGFERAPYFQLDGGDRDLGAVTDL